MRCEPSRRGASTVTAIVPTALWSGEPPKKNGSMGRHVTDARGEQKRSGLEKNTVVIEDFKCGLSLVLFVQNN